MAWRACHEQNDDVLSLPSNRRTLWCKRIGRRSSDARVSQLTKRNRPKADAAFLEEPAPCERLRRNVAIEMVLAIHVCLLAVHCPLSVVRCNKRRDLLQRTTDHGLLSTLS